MATMCLQNAATVIIVYIAKCLNHDHMTAWDAAMATTLKTGCKSPHSALF